MPKLEVLCSHVFKKPITGVRKDSFDHHLSQDLRADIENSYRNKMELHKKKYLLVKPQYYLGIFCLQEWSLFVLLENSLNPLSLELVYIYH